MKLRHFVLAVLVVVFILPAVSYSERGVGDIDEQIRMLSSPNIDVRKNAAWMLGEIRDIRAVEPLVLALKDEKWSGPEEEMRKALLKIGEPAVEPLILMMKNALANKKWGAWQRGALTLGEIKDPRAVEPLISVLENERGVLRFTAVKMLGKLKDPRSIQPLISALKASGYKQYDLRLEAMRALSEIGEPVVEPLIAALKDKNQAQANVAGVLGKIGDPRAVEPLISALKDSSNRGLRERAAWALGKIKDPRVVKPLIFALTDYEGGVRQKAAEALGEIRDFRAVEPLISVLYRDEIQEVRRAAADALGKIQRR